MRLAPCVTAPSLLVLMLVVFPAGFRAAAEESNSASPHGDGGQATTTTDTAPFDVDTPIPGKPLRELNTDLGDKTNTPYTVDAGHFQMETNFVDWIRETDRRTTTDRLAALPTTFKAGVTNTTEVDIFIDAYQQVRREGYDTAHGFGDVILSVKQNLFGNDEPEGAALSLQPWLKIPANTGGVGNAAYEGGLIVPMVFHLPRGFELDAQTELDCVRPTASHEAAWSNSVSLHRYLVEKVLDGYLEFWSSASNQKHTHWQATIDTGLLWSVGENVLLDLAVNAGVTKNAPQIELALGLTFRR